MTTTSRHARNQRRHNLTALRPTRRRLLLETLENRALLTAGAFDPTFGVSGIVTTQLEYAVPTAGAAQASAVQADGKILVVDSRELIRYNDDGTLDESFGIHGQTVLDSGGGGGFNCVAIQPDGKIIVAGTVHHAATGDDFEVTRWLSTGSPDPLFGIGGRQFVDFNSSSDQAAAIAVQSDGRIAVVGVSLQATNDWAIARLNSDGSLDASFGAGGTKLMDFEGNDDFASGVVAQPDGKLVVVGSSDDVEFLAVRFDADGSLDNSFGVDGQQSTHIEGAFTVDNGVSENFAYAVALQSSGKIIIAGNRRTGMLTSDFMVVRLNSDGSQDVSFGTNGQTSIDFTSATGVAALAIGPDDTIIAAGPSAEAGLPQFAVARLTADGALDASFDSDGKQTVDFPNVGSGVSMALRPDGKVILVGNATVFGFGMEIYIVRLNAVGALDTTFNGTGQLLNPVLQYLPATFVSTATALQADGKIVAVGYKSSNSGSDFEVFRYQTNGVLDTSFGTNGRVSIDFNSNLDVQLTVGILADGKIMVAGTTLQPLIYMTALARLNSDGSLDASFADGGKEMIDIGFQASAAAIQPDGKTILGYVTGDKFNVARLNADGTVDTAFGIEGYQTIDHAVALTSIALQPDGGILLAGTRLTGFNDVNGYLYDFMVARLNANGTLDTSFGDSGSKIIDFDSTRDFATSISVGSDGRILVAGRAEHYTWNDDDFETDLLDQKFAAARLNADGSLDSSFGVGGKEIGTTDLYLNCSSAVEPDGKVLLAGNGALLRLASDGSLDASFAEGGIQSLGFDGSSILIQPDGQIVVAGTSLARLLGDTNPDIDGDGIANAVDTLPLTFSNDFSDGTTTGTITSRGDQHITIVDAPNPADGVLITADFLGGAAPATISVVGGASTLTLSAGDQVTVTHGSVILKVLAGSVEATFVASTGEVATATLDSGNGLTFKPDTFTFLAPATNTEIVQATFTADSGQAATVGLASGNSVAFQPITATFIAPTTNTQPLEIVSNGTVVTVSPGETVLTGNRPPTAVNDHFTTYEDASVGGNVLSNDTDPDTHDTLTVTAVNGSLTGVGQNIALAHGTVTLNTNGSFSYTPGLGCGATSDSFTYEISDGHGGTATATVAIVIAQYAGVSTAASILRFGGRAGMDVVTVSGGNLIVNGTSYPLAGVTEVRIWGRGGDDRIDLTGLAIKALIDGGDGNDTLTGGSADDVIFGGTGDDTITGAAGNDFLIGGTGKDRIVGSAGNDILVAGDVDCNLDLAALRLISQAWASSQSAMNTAVDDFIDETVGDANTDQLTGGAGADLFIINSGDTITDFQFGKPKTNKDGDVVIKDGVITT